MPDLYRTVITHNDDGTKLFELYDRDGNLYETNLFVREDQREPDGPWTVNIPTEAP